MSATLFVAHLHDQITGNGPDAPAGLDRKKRKHTHALPKLTPGITYNISASRTRRGPIRGKNVCIGNCAVYIDSGERLPEMNCNKLLQEPEILRASWNSSFTGSKTQEKLGIDLVATVGEWIEMNYSVEITVDITVQPPSPINFAGDANQHEGGQWSGGHDKEPDYVQAIDNLVAGVTYEVNLKLSYKGGKYNGPSSGSNPLSNGDGDSVATLNIHLDDIDVMIQKDFFGDFRHPAANKGDQDLGVTTFVANGTQAKLSVSNSCRIGWFHAHIEGAVKVA